MEIAIAKDSMQLLQSPEAVRKMMELSESDSERNEPSPNVTSNYRHATDKEMSRFRHQIACYKEVVVIFLVYCCGGGVSKLIAFKYFSPLLMLSPG